MTVDILAVILAALKREGVKAQRKLESDTRFEEGVVLVNVQNPAPVANGFTGAATSSRVVLSALALSDSRAFALAESAHDALRLSRMKGKALEAPNGKPLGYLSRVRAITLPNYVSSTGVSDQDVSQVDILLTVTAKAARPTTALDRF